MTLETSSLVNALNGVRNNLKEVGDTARETKREMDSAVRSVKDAESSLEGAAGRVSSTRQRIEGELRSFSAGVLPEQEQRLGEFITFLENEAERGNDTANLLLGNIADLQNGIISTQDIMRQFAGAGGTVTGFEGRIQSLTSVLNDVLPTASQVQSDLRAFVDEFKGRQDEIEILTGRLSSSSSAVSRNIGSIIQGIVAGRGTIDSLINALQNLRNADLGGSEADVLGERLQQLLREGGFG